ncbi:MAG: 50S ribosomal protein L16 [Dehalococcoidia bacterium]|jgi:large subunit ribosomal protein L16|nr:50S ribosomal protein L16 [Chloroflexota bacterium]MCH2494281.1 50S ribosomal protein L16 [Dehalococcoidia bacterium]MQF84023.1 50S ribosomal protein L16 [SAR202 cluster bacterium]MAQ48485.1 50S ribosomal protein L16 [Chloroflexota bacterium]MBS17328.1 50S ribosomal protein L16 [Chloroflexota bacterium]|tara:strand:+ start:9425 stop:9844 length:420 start_codon:yes stop_codon:yes gene_type:complete
MLQPSRTKFRKQQRGKMRGMANRGSTISFGDYALKAQESSWITARQIEAARRAITGHVKRGGQIWIRVFPDKPVSARPAETRMGGGKGAVDRWVSVVKRGRILFEIGDVPEDIAKEALIRAGHKLPIATKIISREELSF